MTRPRIAVLGGGLVGGLIARDLAGDDSFEVRVHDRDDGSRRRLEAAGLATAPIDFRDAGQLKSAIAASDLVVGAVPGFLGRSVQQAAIEAGRPLCDISFTPENPLDLDAVARERGSVLVVDCGVAPGLSNLFVGASAAELGPLERVEIYVGGLPLARVWPFEYRAVFSPTDVIEEYTRTSRVVEHGRVVEREALSDVELIDFPGVGTLEAFLTDGLRTLVETVDAPTMFEKTLRYPGHAERMRMLRETGFFSEEPLQVDGVRIAPRRLTEQLLFRAWELPEGEQEITLLRVVAEGGGRRLRWDLVDRTDPETGATSMARTTGFPCALAARMILDGRLGAAGVHPLEHLGEERAVLEGFLDGLAQRGVRIERREG